MEIVAYFRRTSFLNRGSRLIISIRIVLVLDCLITRKFLEFADSMLKLVNEYCTLAENILSFLFHYCNFFISHDEHDPGERKLLYINNFRVRAIAIIIGRVNVINII